MREYIALIIVGIADGSIVAVAAIGLVLAYKASGIFNFAHGAIGALAAGAFFQLHDVNHVNTTLSILISLLVIGVGLGLIMERVAYLVARASTTMKIVATIGIMVSITSLFNLRFGGLTRQFPTFLPQSGFTVSSVHISWSQVIVVVVGIVLALAMTIFFRRTVLGRAMRAIVDDPQLVGLVGINPTRVRRWAWIISTTFASLAGVLIAPNLGLDGSSLTLLVVASFGAAAIGRFSSLPLTYVGAVVIEVLVALSTKLAATHGSLQNIPTALPFAVLFIVLLVSPKRWLVEVGSALQQRAPTTVIRQSKIWATAKLIPVVVFLLLVPQLFQSHILAWQQGVIYIILMMSLSLLVRLSNQISLTQITFAAVGAVASYHFASDGLPWTLSVLCAGLIAIPVGAFVAIPAVRLSGVYLGLATLSFGLVVETAVYTTGIMFGDNPLPLVTPRPSFATGQNAYYYLILVVAAICYVIVRLVERSRLGQMLRYKADSPVALEMLGVRINLLPLLAFCVAAFLAGVAGALLGPTVGVIGTDSFPTIPTSLLLVALLVLGGRNPRIGTLGASVGAAIGLVVIPGYITNYHVLQGLDLFFGVATVEAAAASSRMTELGRSPALPGWVRRALPSWASRSDTEQPAEVQEPEASLAPAAAETSVTTVAGGKHV
jgi:branched-subunit amino acid ABC-type transport system permease component